ncbi:hypothetical protein Scep_008937 [Stephania cephalantha]|uniref:Cellulose synthase n=1 Tax=Stephania cephalantha TaxID=152367 RepID=A0AAP0PFU1_9MAGN
MVQMAPEASPSSTSPVTIRVSSGGRAGAYRGIALTSPIRRTSLSNNPNSPLSGGRGNRGCSSGGRHINNNTTTGTTEELASEFVSYTVHIPPTPEHQSLNASQSSIPSEVGRSSDSGTVITGRFNSAMMSGDGEPSSEDEDQALPLPSKSEFRPDWRFSLARSFKSTNHPNDFDHARWLFETKGTYGYGNAVWPSDGDGGGEGGGNDGLEQPPDFGEKCRRPMTRKLGVSTALISPYRLLVAIRLAALGMFLTWRLKHPNHEAMWLWAMSIACEIWFSFSWLLDQLPKLCPINRVADLAVLKFHYESPSPRNPKGRSDLPGIDIFVSTADPDKEPPLVTANTILSILSVEYPVEKLACYLSDDGGSLLTFEALAETARFARIWVPFCRKHQIEPRNPETYFGQKRNFLKNKVRLDFVRDRKRVKREYDEFKVRINSLPESINRRSDAYNAHEDLKARRKQVESGANTSEPSKVPKATWMSDGSHWPGTWLSADTDHSRGDHSGIIQAMLAPPSSEPVKGTEADEGNLFDTSEVDIRLPMLVYVSREKRPGTITTRKRGP